MPDETDGKKLHIDSDWKAQARAEKERLAREAETRETASPARGGAVAPGAAEDELEPLPPASFESLVQTLATQAMLFLTPQRDRSGRAVINVELAKHSIDLLGVLEEKTKGNLTDDEKRVLDTALYQTRMAYVRTAGL